MQVLLGDEGGVVGDMGDEEVRWWCYPWGSVSVVVPSEYVYNRI